MTDKHANPEDLDLYALGALDGDDKKTLEAHVRSCPACAQQLAEARQQTALLGLAAAPVAPRPAVKAALMDRVIAEGAAKKRQAAVPAPQNKVKKASWGLRFSLSFAMAAVILGLAAFFLGKEYFEQRQQIRHLQAQLDKAQAQAARDAEAMHAYADVVGAPDTVSVTLQQQAGGPSGQAHVLYNARMGLAVYSGLMSPAPADKSYQLWLVPAIGAPVDAGLVAASQQSGPVVAHFQVGLSAAAFAVTLEPAGGSPQPTGPKVLVGGSSS